METQEGSNETQRQGQEQVRKDRVLVIFAQPI